MNITDRKLSMFLDSSMVEHAAVNRGVVGSSPTRGGNFMVLYEACGHDVCRLFDKDRKGYTDRRKVERKALSTIEFESAKADMGYKV